jgi:ubiquinone/menaquinone biosynthesis C-methylase UbiE
MKREVALNKSVREAAKYGTRRAYNLAHDYVKFADGDVEEDLFSFRKFENYWDYNDITTWKVIKRHLAEVQPGKVLDIGCGAGSWSLRIAHDFPEVKVVGIDYSSGQIDRALELMHIHDFDYRVEFHVADATALPFGDNEFDVSICLHDVLNHVPDYRKAVKETMRVTSKLNITSVHGLYGPPTFFLRSKESITTYEKDGNIVRFGDEDGEDYEVYFRRFSCGELKEGFADYGEVIDCLGIDIFCYKSFDGHEMDYASVFPHFDQLERSCRRELPFIDFAKHIMIVSRPLDGSGKKL